MHKFDKDNTTTAKFSPHSYPIDLHNIVVTGSSLGLPGMQKAIFASSNISDILTGTNFIDRIPEDKLQRILDKNIKKILKRADGNKTVELIDKVEQLSKFAGMGGTLDLTIYGVPQNIIATLDRTYELAIAAGIEVLKDANIQLGGENSLELPEAYQRGTGVIFASSFPVLDAFANELSHYFRDKISREFLSELEDFYANMKANLKKHEQHEFETYLNTKKNEISTYAFNRKLLFKLLVMGNAQLAQLIKAKGPNTTINAACASTSQAVCIAEDWIKLGRAERVIIISADDATSDSLLEWIGTGFLILGASSLQDELAKAALPFDKKRNGMILSMGAVGLLVENEKSAVERGAVPYCSIIGTHFVNSAFHGTAVDGTHVSDELNEFISRIERNYGIQREVLASQLAYFSHETYTSANGGVAKAEIDALRHVFGKQYEEITIVNTKGYTGHPMGVGFEEVVAAHSFREGILPPLANTTEIDPALGNLKTSTGEAGEMSSIKYILRFAAGFGSQLVYLLLKSYEKTE